MCFVVLSIMIRGGREREKGERRRGEEGGERERERETATIRTTEQVGASQREGGNDVVLSSVALMGVMATLMKSHCIVVVTSLQQ